MRVIPPSVATLEVCETSHGLELKSSADTRGVALDIEALARRVRQGHRGALARACGTTRQPLVLDAMAGLGLDGMTLAALGCRVVMLESNALVHRVLVDGVARAVAAVVAAIAAVDGARPEVRNVDAMGVLRGGERWDVVYLDPMFQRRRKGALPKKGMQLLGQAVQGDTGSSVEDLVRAAVAVARDRVVLKRRARDARVLEPAWTIAASRVRFDVYRGQAEP